MNAAGMGEGGEPSSDLCLGIVTSGQGPRPDIEEYHRLEFRRLGRRIRLICEHAFETVPIEEARQSAVSVNRHSIVAPFRNSQARGHRLGAGWEALALSVDAYPERLAACVSTLEEKGADITLFACAAELPGVSVSSRQPFILPRHLLVDAVVSISRALSRPLRLGVIVISAHRDTDVADWSNVMTGVNVQNTFLETDGTFKDLIQVGTTTSKLDLVCILGYGFGCAPGDELLISDIERRLGAPVLLPAEIATRFVSQIAGHGRSVSGRNPMNA